MCFHGFLRTSLVIGALLLTATVAVYSPVRGFDYVNFDDPDYTTANPHVRAGLTIDGARWAFTSAHAANWIPVTWLSHMTDFQMFGPQSGPQHVINVLLHGITALLVYAFFWRATGARWRSAFVAVLFALHPLHVESVAWIAERKDVLSGLFWFLTLWLYVLFVEGPGVVRYLFVAAAFALGLMSKPMVVTLPLVLLLVDVWPLRRAWNWRLLLDKIPLMALSVAASIVTYIVQQRGGAVLSLESVPFGARIANGFISYVAYLGGMIWPARLAVFYPYPHEVDWWNLAGALVVIGAISWAVFRLRKQFPYLGVGWLWYLVTLVPVIGWVQIGEQARADRYTYLALVGIGVMLAWGGAEVAARWPKCNAAIIGVSAAACAAWMVVSAVQLQYWRNSETLFRHALAVTTDNYVAYTNLGVALRSDGRVSEAVRDFEEAVRIRPLFVDARNDLGEALLVEGRAAEAIQHLEDALHAKPDFVDAHVNLGAAYDKLGRSAEAAQEFQAALKLQPDNAVAHAGLGAILADQGQTDEGVRELQVALAIDPDYAAAHFSLGLVMANSGRAADAVAQFSEAARLRPNDAEAHYNLGTALGSEDRLAEAVEQFNIALRLRPNDVGTHVNLGKALANMGRLDEAAAQFTAALRIDPGSAEARESLRAVGR